MYKNALFLFEIYSQMLFPPTKSSFSPNAGHEKTNKKKTFQKLLNTFRFPNRQQSMDSRNTSKTFPIPLSVKLIKAHPVLSLKRKNY